VSWQYLKYLPFATGTYDHIYAYSANYQNGDNPSNLGNLTAKEFAMRAQIVQLQQYQALYEGFSLFQWRNYSAVLLWKSQSPWPALRGALYDYYLDYTGGFWGVHNALSMYSMGQCTLSLSEELNGICVDDLGMISAAGLHAMMNPTTRQVSVINRHAVDSRADLAVRVSCSDLYGKELSSRIISIGIVPANGAVTSDVSILWPTGLEDDAVVLFFLDLISSTTTVSGRSNVEAKVFLPNLYWLSSPSHGDRHDYSQLGALQLEDPALVTVTVRLPWTSLGHDNPVDPDEELRKLGFSGAHLVAAKQPIDAAIYTAVGESIAVVESGVGFSIVEISCHENSPAVAFMLQLTLLTSDPTTATNTATVTDPRVLPTFFSLNYITLRPSESVFVVVASAVDLSFSETRLLEIEGWNVPSFIVAL